MALKIGQHYQIEIQFGYFRGKKRLPYSTVVFVFIINEYNIVRNVSVLVNAKLTGICQ